MHDFIIKNSRYSTTTTEDSDNNAARFPRIPFNQIHILKIQEKPVYLNFSPFWLRYDVAYVYGWYIVHTAGSSLLNVLHFLCCTKMFFFFRCNGVLFSIQLSLSCPPSPLLKIVFVLYWFILQHLAETIFFLFFSSLEYNYEIKKVIYGN